MNNRQIKRIAAVAHVAMVFVAVYAAAEIVDEEGPTNEPFGSLGIELWGVAI